jgi:alpha-ketoglutarate-dependent 2,4-dichlorophenoxyacetate dioxygenase
MPVSIRPLHRVFAGEVSGIDCRKPLSAGEIDVVEAGMNEYAVLIFRDQNLTDEEQIAFTRHFGELENYNTPGHVRKREDQRLGPGIADFSNLDKHGNIMSDEDRVWFFKLGRPAVALRQFVPPGAGEIFAALRACPSVMGRQHRIRRYAHRL